MIHFNRAAALLVLLTLMQCSQQLAGAGSETTNGITGCVKNSDLTPAANAIVKLLPDGYDPVAQGADGILADTTGADGKYRFSRLQTGSYNVLARSADLTAGSLVWSIAVSDDSLTPVPPTGLAVSGAISAGFANNATVDSGTYVYIPGTDIFSRISSDGTALLADVPPGQVATVVLATSSGVKRNVLRGDVTVASNDTVVIRNAGWKYSKELLFNTTSAGAGVLSDVYDFPALIRLTERYFDFSQAAIDGSDLRFDRSDGTPAAFEIERWDAAANRAEVWVTIDTLRGNSNNQSITMYWGASPSTLATHASAVFDTTADFAGVWHLSDALQDSIRDATDNRIHGISPDTARPPVATGIIGNCREFNGTTNYITMPNSAGSALNYPQNGHYTISAWVYVDASDDTRSHVIVSKGNTQYFLWYTPIHLNATHWEFADYRDGSGWDLSISPITGGEWIHLTGVRDGATQHLYVNGEPVDTLIDYPYPFGAVSRNTASDLMIGRFAQVMASPNNDEGYCFFKGKIDELRICGAVRNADWVRLCYMNQRTDNKLVTFK